MKYKTPTCVPKWMSIFMDIEEEWSVIFSRPYKSVRETQFQYKIIHRIIVCNKKLFDMKIKDSPNCNFCNQIDDIYHFFFYCPMVQTLWWSFFNWWNSLGHIVLDFNQSVNVKHILFGLQRWNRCPLVLDYCVMYTKLYIYKHRLHRQNELDIRGLQSYLKWKIKIEPQICTNERNPKAFDKFMAIYDILNNMFQPH